METKGVFTHGHQQEATTKIIPSHMIIKEKVDSDGNFIKWKSRLVAGGHRSIVASLLYISINIRYDTLLLVNYLSTKVNKYNEHDKKIVIRILEYLNNTINED